ncbi:MAG: hypothetical protein Q7K54_02675 [Candidatus Parcubacteria bacterium]|nr:hypothetical protein [Candidatus Parcubacteria bacterium]
MDDILKLSEEIQKKLQKLDNEILQSISTDHSKAIEYIKNNKQRLSNEQVKSIAQEMQIVAQMLLKERANK